MNSTQTFTILDIITAIFKSPIKFILWFLAFFSLVILAYLIVPREYGSDGKLFVQVGRSSIGATPTTSAGSVSLQDSRDTEINSVVGLLKSREMADRVVEVIGVERILKPNSAIGRFTNNLPSLSRGGGTAVDDGETDLTSDEINAIKQRNKAIKQLMQSINVRHDKNTTVVSIGMKAQTPFLARDLVEAYLEQYKKKHVEVHTPQGSGFFNEQLQIRKQALLDSEKKLEQFRSGFEVLDIGSARSILQREIDQLKLDALDTAVKFSEAQEKAFQMTKAYADVPEFISGADTKTSSLARDKAREALFNLELQESEMASRYKDGNPKLSAIRNTVNKAKSQLKSIPETFQESERNVNLAHKEILVMLTKSKADANGFEKRLQATEALLELKIREVGKLNQMARTESQIVLDVEIQKKAMLSIADKTAESVTIDALDNENISNVNIVQEACLVPKKMFPSGMTFAVFGGALSAVLATMMTFFRQFRIRYEDDRKRRQHPEEQTQLDSNQSRQPRSRRVDGESAISASGPVVRTDSSSAETSAGNPQGNQSSGDAQYTEDETEDGKYPESSDRSQGPLHQERQEETGVSVQAMSGSQSRSIALEQRSKNQVNFFLLLGGFGLFLIVYLLTFVLR